MSDIIHIGDFQVKSKMGKPCRHSRILYDPHGCVIQCQDCESYIDPFKAFMKLVRNFKDKEDSIKRQQTHLEALLEKHTHLIAARKVESVWRSKYLPCCPHCSEPIYPDDGLGTSSIAKKYHKRKKKKQ